jgi:hypothetical protein
MRRRWAASCTAHVLNLSSAARSCEEVNGFTSTPFMETLKLKARSDSVDEAVTAETSLSAVTVRTKYQ